MEAGAQPLSGQRGPPGGGAAMDSALRAQGLYRKRVAKDGSCLFRAVAEQVKQRLRVSGEGSSPRRGGCGRRLGPVCGRGGAAVDPEAPGAGRSLPDRGAALQAWSWPWGLGCRGPGKDCCAGQVVGFLLGRSRPN